MRACVPRDTQGNIVKQVTFLHFETKSSCSTRIREKLDRFKIYRGYYTVARRYEFYVRVARTITREHKIHIFELTCNVLFII